MLDSLRAAIAVRIDQRKCGMYAKLGVDEHLRDAEQRSLAWTSAADEQMFRCALATVGTIAAWLDDTLCTADPGRWNDFNMSYHFPVVAALNTPRSHFRVRLDTFAETGEVPPVTGVYVALHDPHASLQFAFDESAGRTLRDANTFNRIGVAALDFTGRDELWLDHQKMFEFATSKKYASRFRVQRRRLRLTLGRRLHPPLVQIRDIELARLARGFGIGRCARDALIQVKE